MSTIATLAKIHAERMEALLDAAVTTTQDAIISVPHIIPKALDGLQQVIITGLDFIADGADRLAGAKSEEGHAHGPARMQPPTDEDGEILHVHI